ncbi:Sec-independent protein translocase subunit TatC [Endothiovibrio diazotrophicus]
MPFLSHLVELRDRLMRAVLGVLAAFLLLFPFSNDLYTLLAAPLMRHLPANASMVAIDVASPFFTPFKLAMVAAVFLAMPYILHQMWAFIAPGLYRHEKRFAIPLLVSSVVLFYSGATFAYFVVFPLIFAFLTGSAPEGVSVMTDIARYLDFVLTLFFAFGFAFEVPIATFLLCKVGLTTPDSLRSKRPYIIVGAFVIGMLLTPPDAISQTLLAIPMWMLFELGLFFSARFAVPAAKDGTDGDPGEEELEYELQQAEAAEEALDEPDPAAARVRPEDETAWQNELDELGDEGTPRPPEPDAGKPTAG